MVGGMRLRLILKLRTVLNLFLANEVESLQNVFTPFPLTAHIIIAIASVVVFFIQFYRKGGIYYLFMGAAVAATLITQMPNFSSNKNLIFALEVIESVLCVLIIVFFALSCVKNRRQKALEKASIGQADNNNDTEAPSEYSDLEQIAQNSIDNVQKELREQSEKDKNENPVDNAFDDDNGDLDIYL